MGRSSTATNSQGAYQAQGNQAFDATGAEIGQYDKNIADLKAGKNVGANPFQQTGYLSNVNKLQSEALHGGADAAKAEMMRRNHATGGLNSSQTVLGQRDVGLETGRLGDTLSAQRAASDYRSNLEWQRYLAGAPLPAAGLNADLYKTATAGEGNALNNLTSLSGQKYGFYGGILNSALSGAGVGAGIAMK